eukprot:9478351-Pyramimonas_sp.AAC.1
MLLPPHMGSALASVGRTWTYWTLDRTPLNMPLPHHNTHLPRKANNGHKTCTSEVTPRGCRTRKKSGLRPGGAC